MPTYDLATRVAAGTTYRARAYAATAVPTTFERHMLNRMGCGYSRDTWQQVRAQGGAQQWFAAQLDPASVPESALTDSLVTWFPRVADAPATRATRNDTRSYGAWEYARDIGNYTTLRRMYSQRQVLETMVDFWNNHLHVPVNANRSWVMRWDYDQTVRSHALGRFEDLLVACSLHPAMLLYLDNRPVGARRPQREPGPRAARAAHPGAHLGLHRADGQGLARRSCRDGPWTRGPVGGVLRPRSAHHRAGAGARLHRTRTAPPTVPTCRRALPALPGQPPGHRPDGRAGG